MIRFIAFHVLEYTLVASPTWLVVSRLSVRQFIPTFRTLCLLVVHGARVFANDFAERCLFRCRALATNAPGTVALPDNTSVGHDAPAASETLVWTREVFLARFLTHAITVLSRNQTLAFQFTLTSPTFAFGCVRVSVVVSLGTHGGFCFGFLFCFNRHRNKAAKGGVTITRLCFIQSSDTVTSVQTTFQPWLNIRFTCISMMSSSNSSGSLSL